jgi:NAD(P)-dependent dehydrogenase (short-subunit alcohol dehydrogenase family)
MDTGEGVAAGTVAAGTVAAGTVAAGTNGAPVALITGASQGLGRVLAAELARRGWRLVIDARRADRLATTAAELSASSEVVALAGDVTDAAHRGELVGAVAGLGGGAVVVNNASTLGGSPLPALATVEPDVVRRTFEVNVVAPLALLRELRAAGVDVRAVVNVTSDAGVEAYEGWGVYGASKAALEHASRVLAVEQPGTRVLVVDPGDMRTEMHQDAFPGEDISDRPPPDASARAIVALIEREAPSGRYLASAVLSDALDDALSDGEARVGS